MKKKKKVIEITIERLELHVPSGKIVAKGLKTSEGREAMLKILKNVEK